MIEIEIEKTLRFTQAVAKAVKERLKKGQKSHFNVSEKTDASDGSLYIYSEKGKLLMHTKNKTHQKTEWVILAGLHATVQYYTDGSFIVEYGCRVFAVADPFK